MRKPSIHQNHTKPAGLTGLILICLCLCSPVQAALKPVNPIVPADSLVRLAAGYYQPEPSVQAILDASAGGLSAKEMVTREWFCAPEGGIAAGMLAGHSSLADQISLNWYSIHSQGDPILLLPAGSAAGDSGIFFLPRTDSIGWCLRGPSDLVWYSEARLNSDLLSHVRFYPASDPGTYFMFWEDIDWLGDGDFNDYVAWVRFPRLAPELHLSYATAAGSLSKSAPGMCVNITADASACGADPISVRLVDGPGTFEPVMDFGSVSAQHCFVPPSDGLYTLVFEASVPGALPDIDTLTVTAGSAALLSGAPDISISLYNDFTICEPETLAIPFTITSSCQITSVSTKPPAYVDLANSALKLFVGVPFESCVPLVVRDACGGKDSVSVCIIVHVKQKTTITCPAIIDTTLCESGYVCYPLSVTGGTPPITVGAASPAYYNSYTGYVCYPVNQSGVYSVITYAQNASCPPETCVTEVRAKINTPPRFEGIPNSTVSVCGTGAYCYGPISCADTDGNVTNCAKLGGPGTFDGQYWCYTPSGTQTVEAIFRATDACGQVAWDTLKVSFSAAATPVITFNSLTTQLCNPQTVCVPYSVNSGGGPAPTMSLIGQGVLDVANSKVCLPINASGVYPLVLVAAANCGLSDTAQATITATLNAPPTVTCAPPDADTISAGSEVCVGYSISDPDGGSLGVNITGPGFTIPRQALSGTSDQVCFTVANSGTQTVRIIVTDACGKADTCTTIFPIWVNAGPSVTARDTTVFQCSPQPICVSVTCSDPDNNLVSCNAQGSKPGTFDGEEFCFTPDTAGTYTVSLSATDAFGTTATHTTIVRVSYNQAPDVQIIGNPNVEAPAGQSVCFSYTTSDPNGNISSVVARGSFSSFTSGQICVTGVAGSVVCARVVATDACGRKDSAQVCVTSSPGFMPKPNLPDTVEIRLCEPGIICIPFSMGQSDCPPITLSALGGASIQIAGPDTSLCFNVAQPGIYHLGVQATDLCGTESAEVVLIASANNPPQIVCPQPEVAFICDIDTVCVTIAYADPDSNFMEAVASFGTLDAAFKGLFEICLPVDTTGWYSSQIIVRDSCGEADTCNFRTQVLRNTPPQIVSPGDTSIFLCYPMEVCLPVSCFDPDYNFISCGPVSLGDAHWNGTTLCFTPLVSGDYQWVFRAEDACGEIEFDTVRAAVQINRRPSITAPETMYFRMCSPESVLVDYEISDPDGGPLICYIEDCEACSGEIKLYRETSGTTCINLIVRDQCFAADTTRVCVTFDINTPPVVTAPPDFTQLACGFGSVCFDVAIQDNWTKWTGSVSPIGTFNPADTSVCFYADTAGTYRLIVTATDSCGAIDKDTVNVTVKFNVPPVVTAPSQNATLCSPGQVCVGGITVYDADGNVRRFYLASGDGVFDSSAGTLCFQAQAAGLYCFGIAAEDSCGETDLRNLCVNVSINGPPSVTISGLDGSPVFFKPTEMCFSVSANDPNAGQLFDLDLVQGSGTFTRRIAHAPITAQHCFLADTSGCYRFIFESTDSCGLMARDTATVCIRVEIPDTMFRVCIDTVESLNGRNAVVKIRGIEMMEMGGYDFLICYDPTMLNFSQAAKDSALSQWEYFTYRVGSATGCVQCGANVIRLVGIADMNNGAAHPPDWAFTPKGPMHKLTFFVTADRTFLNQCAPIQFCIYDCGDNTISSKSGDSLFTELSGVPENCFEGGKYPPVPLIAFCDGLICIVPPEDDRGDINLNGIVNEVADAVLFSNWFIYGDVVWDPLFKENQILATDVNCDGLVLTLSDLVKLIRLVTGDDAPQGCADGPAKVAVPVHTARVTAEKTAQGLEFWLESGVDLGGAFVRLAVADGEFGDPRWEKELGGLKPQFHRANGEMRFLLVGMQSGTALPSGRSRLFTLPWDGSGHWEIKDAQTAGVGAELMSTEVSEGGASLPRSHSLGQNYPNPFNASTQIRFRLGSAAAWEVSIYNVLGQVVRRFEGEHEAGDITIEWDARSSSGDDLASGVYFTRLKVGEFTTTRKMVLLK